MRQSIKNIIMGLLIWACIIWAVCFDPSQLGQWFKVAICLVSATVFFWWIFDFENPFVEDKSERV